MKNAMILGLIIGSLSISLVSAMEMKGDTMMKDDKMMMEKSMGDTMMKDDKMMKKDYSKMSTLSLAKTMGYSWKKDRVMLAEKAGVTGYTGTASQNLKIRTYLMSMMNDKMMMKGDTMMKDSMKK